MTTTRTPIHTHAAKIRRGLASGALLALTIGLAVPAQAAIPPAVAAMIREAARSGDDATVAAVVKVAKATNPDDADAINDMAQELLAQTKKKAELERREKLLSRTFWHGWTGEGQAGFGSSSGNTNETSLVLGLKLNRDGLRTKHKFKALVDYLRSGGVTSRERYGLDYAFNYTIDDGLYAVTTLAWSRDRFSGYGRRFTESLGLGYTALDSSDMKLSLEFGPALRQTRYIDSTHESVFSARGSLSYHWKISKGVEFSQDASAIVGNNNNSYTTNTALTTKLLGALSARLSYDMQTETNPPPGLENTDTSTRATLVYDF